MSYRSNHALGQMKYYLIAAIAGMAIACGGGGGGDGNGDVDGGVDIPGGGSCTDGKRSTSDRYLPLDVGNQWRYRVDDLTDAMPTTKQQQLTEMMEPDPDTGPVVVQVTMKSTGRTENWLRRDGDMVVRLRQQDFDINGELERTTYYLPKRVRFDESPDHIVQDATWTDNFVRKIEDPTGLETKRETVVDQWTVLGVDVPCQTPWGELQCLHVRRVRLEGGISQKEYWFARGYGKVREEGRLIEELLGCELQ